jgi:hypothetical protein
MCCSMWGRREGVSFILWAVRESGLRCVFPLRWCVWSDGVLYWGVGVLWVRLYGV